MSPENQHFESNTSKPANSEDPLFDVAAADRERLAWRVGGEEPTKRALGRDEALARQNQEAIDTAREAKSARLEELSKRLGGVASQELRPEDN